MDINIDLNQKDPSKGPFPLAETATHKYGKVWYECVHHHHAAEEEFFFPELERVLDRPGIMDTNVEQHKAFHDKLDEWGKQTYKTSPGEYDGTKWKRMIEEFAPPLLTHLHDELVGLEELAQTLDEQGLAKMADVWKRLNDKMIAETNKSRIFPLVLGAFDRNFEGGMHRFPDGPFFLPYIVDWIFGYRHRGAWRFSPSDMHGNPRSLKITEAAYHLQ